MADRRLVAKLIALACLASAPTLSATPTAQPFADRPALSNSILEVHNRHRSTVGAAPLRWSADLARSAAGYGPELAGIGRLVHSAKTSRVGQSENLWSGTRGVYSIEAMVEYWAEERLRMRAGLFPGVSITGNWLDVSHYTQMIWPDTTHVGCHVQQSPTQEFLICRYSPKGNRDGRAVGRQVKDDGPANAR